MMHVVILVQGLDNLALLEAGLAGVGITSQNESAIQEAIAGAQGLISGDAS
jgi:hypothetical protein